MLLSVKVQFPQCTDVLIYFPGIIEKVTSKSVTVNFMVRHQSRDDLFQWPPTEDKHNILRRNILFYFNKAPVAVDRIFFSLPQKEEVDDALKRV